MTLDFKALKEQLGHPAEIWRKIDTALSGIYQATARAWLA